MNERAGFVEAAMRDGAVTRRDERGLMPLAEARALVQRAVAFRKGGGRLVGGSFVLDSDRLWAALMSLRGADEFVQEATRLRWYFHPRGKDNIAAVERYGHGILPWLQHFILRNGVLINVPWCVVPCFQQIGTPEVFSLLWDVREVHGPPADAWPGSFAADQPGDMEIDLDDLAARRFDEPQPSAHSLVIGWVFAQPAVGFVELSVRSEQGDPRARRMLKSLAEVDPEDAFGWAASALGAERTRAAFAAAGAPAEINADAILAMLDNAVDIGWPPLFGEPCYHAIRLVAARERHGTDWGVVFERIEGASTERAGARLYVVGSRVYPGPIEPARDLLVFEDEYDDSTPAAVVVGPAGPIHMDEALVSERDLRPGMATGPEVASTRLSVLVRAYLALHPDSLWSPVEDVVRALGLGDDPEIVVVSSAFQHTVGPRGPEAYPPAWRAWPSRCPVYQSLARALMARDGSLFKPGEPNLDWRLHALAVREGSE